MIIDLNLTNLLVKQLNSIDRYNHQSSIQMGDNGIKSIENSTNIDFFKIIINLKLDDTDDDDVINYTLDLIFEGKSY